jgi:hypothetical protein
MAKPIRSFLQGGVGHNMIAVDDGQVIGITGGAAVKQRSNRWLPGNKNFIFWMNLSHLLN